MLYPLSYPWWSGQESNLRHRQVTDFFSLRSCLEHPGTDIASDAVHGTHFAKSTGCKLRRRHNTGTSAKPIVIVPETGTPESHCDGGIDVPACRPQSRGHHVTLKTQEDSSLSKRQHHSIWSGSARRNPDLQRTDHSPLNHQLRASYTRAAKQESRRLRARPRSYASSAQHQVSTCRLTISITCPSHWGAEESNDPSTTLLL